LDSNEASYDEEGGIKWYRIRTIDLEPSDNPLLDFNTFFNKHLKEYQNRLIADSGNTPWHILIERKNLEAMTQVIELFPNEDQIIQLDSHIDGQIVADRPDYYIRIHHCALKKAIQGFIDIIVFIGCQRGKAIGKTKTFGVVREIKYDLSSGVKGFREIKSPKQLDKWEILNDLQ
jgi:hypothetical protein